MKNQHTEIHTYLLDSGIEIWLEPDVYCPRLIVKRPRKIKISQEVLSQTMEPFQQIIKNEEYLFIEDPIYYFIANPDIENKVKLNTANQLKELAEKMERMVKEKIEEEELNDENL